jgi:hypothetical protein
MPCLVIIVGSRRSPNTWYSSRTGYGDPSFKPTPMPTARHGMAAASLGPGLAGVFGGQLELNVNEVYNLTTNTWSTRANMPTGRHYLAAAPLGPGLVGVFGGYNNLQSNLVINEVYNHNTNTWD